MVQTVFALLALLLASSQLVLANYNTPYLENEDANLTVPEILRKYGYPVEVHEITTADGYILQAHRIPYGKRSGPSTNRPVVWLQHGLLGDSSNFILNNEDKALGYVLANAGYDVWMGNARGNHYSRRHVTYSNSSPEYWDFSWHQMGIYDIPAVIDHVLRITGQAQLNYVGHSMGSTMFFVAMSERPEYNSKIRLMSAMAPVAFMGNVRSPVKYLAPISNSLELILGLLGKNEFGMNPELYELLGETLCRAESPFNFICKNAMFLIAGWGSDQHNATLLPIVLGHSPSSTSSRTLVHYAQGIQSHLFRKFNYCKQKNLEEYGQELPPEYDLRRVTAPVALYWADNDWLADPTDVARLRGILPNVVRNHRVANDKFNHLDYLWARDNDVLTVRPVSEFISSFVATEFPQAAPAEVAPVPVVEIKRNQMQNQTQPESCLEFCNEDCDCCPEFRGGCYLAVCVICRVYAVTCQVNSQCCSGNCNKTLHRCGL